MSYPPEAGDPQSLAAVDSTIDAIQRFLETDLGGVV